MHSGYTLFYQYVCSLGIELTTFCVLLTQCSSTEPQEHYIWCYSSTIHYNASIVLGCPLKSSRCFSFIFREDSPRVVDVILTRQAEFSSFATYISDYDRSMSLLEESCRQSKAFEDVVKRFEVRSDTQMCVDCLGIHPNSIWKKDSEKKLNW